MAAGGVLEMHGKAYAPTWTRLSASAMRGSKRLQLIDDVNWEVGQELVIVTTAWRDDTASHQNEVHRIVILRDDFLGWSRGPYNEFFRLVPKPGCWE